MIDIFNFNRKLKLDWLRRISCHNGICTLIAKSMFNVEKLINTGKMYAEKTKAKLKNKFWIDVFSSHITYIGKFRVQSSEHILDVPLFITIS